MNTRVASSNVYLLNIGTHYNTRIRQWYTCIMLLITNTCISYNEWNITEIIYDNTSSLVYIHIVKISTGMLVSQLGEDATMLQEYARNSLARPLENWDIICIAVYKSKCISLILHFKWRKLWLLLRKIRQAIFCSSFTSDFYFINLC